MPTLSIRLHPGTTNRITAAVCKLTHGQPGSVCQSAAVTAVNGDI